MISESHFRIFSYVGKLLPFSHYNNESSSPNPSLVNLGRRLKNSTFASVPASAFTIPPLRFSIAVVRAFCIIIGKRARVFSIVSLGIYKALRPFGLAFDVNVEFEIKVGTLA